MAWEDVFGSAVDAWARVQIADDQADAAVALRNPQPYVMPDQEQIRNLKAEMQAKADSRTKSMLVLGGAAVLVLALLMMRK